MSHKANDWAWTLPVRGTRQHVLLALAKKAKPKTETATPSMPELVEMTGLAESTIRAHIQALAKDGYIDVTVSSGGRHKRSTYRLLADCISLSTPREMDRREGGETPQEGDLREPETPQELAENPPTAGPVVLRTKSGTRGGTTSAAAASEPEFDGLFAVAAPSPSKAVATVKPKPVAASVNGGAIWTDAYRSTHDGEPITARIKQAAKAASNLLRAGNPPDRVAHACRVAGERGYAAVDHVYGDLAKQSAARTSGRPTPDHRPSTTQIRVDGALALAHALEERGE